MPSEGKEGAVTGLTKEEEQLRPQILREEHAVALKACGGG